LVYVVVMLLLHFLDGSIQRRTQRRDEIVEVSAWRSVLPVIGKAEQLSGFRPQVLVFPQSPDQGQAEDRGIGGPAARAELGKLGKIGSLARAVSYPAVQAKAEGGFDVGGSLARVPDLAVWVDMNDFG
jgi:hypothetical protein